MNILMLCEDFYPMPIGGIGVHAFQLSNELRRNSKDDITIVVAKMDQGQQRYIRQDNFKLIEYLVEDTNDIFHYYPQNLAILNSSVWKEILHDERIDLSKYDCIHVHDYYLASVAVGISEKFSIPIISTIHSISPPMNHIVYSLRGFLLRNSSVVITVSKWMKNEILIKYPFISANDIHVIPNGINQLTTKKNIVRTKNKILFVGRLAESKGVDILLKAFKKISTKYQNIILDIIGEGEERKKLETLVIKLGISEKVMFYGYLDGVEIYKKSNQYIFSVIPSRYEPFGIVALEHQSNGIPVIASATGGLKEIVTDGVNGLLFTPGSETELINKMDKLIFNEELQIKLCFEGLKNIKKYSWEEIAIKTLHLYSESEFIKKIGTDKAYHYLW